MVNINETLMFMFPSSDPTRNWSLTEDNTAVMVWRRPEPQPTAAEIVAAMLPASKVKRIEADRTECRRRLTEFYGDALEQVSRASGLYGATAQANHAAGVSAAIDASNVARDLINAATTVAEVEAVTVAWPTLT